MAAVLKAFNLYFYNSLYIIYTKVIKCVIEI